MLSCQLLSKHAMPPTRGSPGAAGYDVTCAHSIVIPAGGSAHVETDLAIQIPEGYYGQIASRSGLAFKYGVEAFSGIIDSDYRGAIGILLRNHGKVDYPVKRGDRVAQLLIIPCLTDTIIVHSNALSYTDRGTDGFGSTGK